MTEYQCPQCHDSGKITVCDSWEEYCRCTEGQRKKDETKLNYMNIAKVRQHAANYGTFHEEDF